MPPTKMAVMTTHLDQKCEECLETSETWRLVLNSPKDREDNLDRNTISLNRSVSTQKGLEQTAQPARLIFDSQVEPKAAIRSIAQSSRQLIHEAKPFVIDLRLESKSSHKRILLIGQVVNAQDPDNTIRGIDIILLSEDRLLMKTRANSSGEFDFDYSPEPNLQLLINIRGYRAIALFLPDLPS